MASHLCLTVQEVQRTTTSKEFVKWIWYLDWKDSEEFNRSDFYMAQIAAVITRGQVKNPEKIKVQDFILKFNQKAPSQTKDSKEKMMASKNFWLTATGVIGNKKKKNRLPKKVRKKPKKKSEE